MTDMAAENKKDHLSYIFSFVIFFFIRMYSRKFILLLLNLFLLLLYFSLFACIPGNLFLKRYIYLLNLFD